MTTMNRDSTKDKMDKWMDNSGCRPLRPTVRWPSTWSFLAPPAGIEPATCGLGTRSLCAGGAVHGFSRRHRPDASTPGSRIPNALRDTICGRSPSDCT